MTRQNRLMQEALDKNLNAQERSELYSRMDESPADAAEFQRLRQVDRTLRNAPMEHAPQSLAFKIMSRIAEGLQPEQLRRSSGLALAVGLALVALVVLPVLVVLTVAVVGVVTSASAFGTLITQVAHLLGLLVSALTGLVSGAQDMLRAYPEAPLLMLTLIPIPLLWLARFAWQNREQA